MSTFRFQLNRRVPFSSVFIDGRYYFFSNPASCAGPGKGTADFKTNPDVTRFDTFLWMGLEWTSSGVPLKEIEKSENFSEASGGFILCPPQNSMATCIQTSEDTFSTKSIIFWVLLLQLSNLVRVFSVFYYVLLCLAVLLGLVFSYFEGNTLFQRLIYFPTMNKHQRALSVPGKVHLSSVLNKSWFTVCIVFPSFRPAIWPHQHSHSKNESLGQVSP